MNCSTAGLPVHHQLPEFIQTHIHWVSDVIQPSHPLSSPSPPVFNLSQHQGLFQWLRFSYQVAKVLEFQLPASVLPMNIQDWFPLGLFSFRIDWFHLLTLQGSLKSLLQQHSSKASIHWLLAFFIVQLSHPYMTTGKTIALTRPTFVGNPQGNQSWIFIWRTNAKAETLIFWPPDAKNWLTGKDSDDGKDWRQKEKGITEDKMMGWHHRLDGHEFEQAPGVGDGQGSLACYSPWSHKVLDTTEQLNNWTTVTAENYVASGNTQSRAKPCVLKPSCKPPTQVWVSSSWQPVTETPHSCPCRVFSPSLEW